ncbi:ribose-phosphate pyrophosphokinase [Nannochloropsis gaditana CCMP526]|uniref:ribose-phosphate pyrophosphokinase n=1 Tax=Nannochloropsis gaditana (strain CCMP526) TaxID=1093141 RepID=UPI00029F544E|nr:ribose-phosphate pyrophosphokinase [Nannochloropsis gaditana CCMP526]EKU21888.1 ribose-phosphate pyrophosphokinase [Nannochloropsis gaditana CCMP526]|eukprot:XP_005854471.1 ribose-phosphate pyrophosphokinase [Nannochloropsis gaditana CCMP526]
MVIKRNVDLSNRAKGITRMDEGDEREVEEGWYASEVAERLARRTSRTFEELKAKWRWSAAEGPRQDPSTISNLVVFSGSSHPLLAEEICDYLNIPVGNSVVKRFADGEVFIRILQEIRGRDCFVIIPTNSNDNVIELLLSISTMRRASAKRITAVIPYFGYARQDQRTPFRREPIAAADIARMLEEVGVDRVVSVDLHSGQIQKAVLTDNLFALVYPPSFSLPCSPRRVPSSEHLQGFFSPRVPVDHLTPAAAAAAYFVENVPDFKRHALHPAGVSSSSSRYTVLNRATSLGPCPIVTVVAPTKDKFAALAFSANDFRSSWGPMCLSTWRTCIIVDDLLDTGKTLATTVDLLKGEGADRVYGFATHARAIEIHPLHDKIHQLSVAPLIAEAILNIHDCGSVSSVVAGDQEMQSVLEKSASNREP